MKLLRRIFIALVGGAVLLIGIAMIVLPAPGILVIPVGLAILAIEFVWARQCLHLFRQYTVGKKNTPSGIATPTLEPVSLPKVSMTEGAPTSPVNIRSAPED